VWEAVEDKADEAKIAEADDKKTKMKREKKKEFRKPTVEEEMEIARMIEEKQEEEEDLMEIRMIEKMVSRRFHKYLKMFKKNSEKMLTRKT